MLENYKNRTNVNETEKHVTLLSGWVNVYDSSLNDSSCELNISELVDVPQTNKSI